jgi:hypothetical protein
MILDCVLTSVNLNPLYIDFIPIFVKTWNKLYPSVDVKIILVADEIPEQFMEYKSNIILFKPIDNVLTSFTAQFIRLLYPSILNYKNGILITDMDMLPMNRSYYTKNVEPFDNSKFIYYRGNVCFEYKQLAMCYNIATNEVWRDVFKINNIEDIRNYILSVSNTTTIKEGHGNLGWSTDQLVLYEKIMEWNAKTGNLVCLDESKTGYKRLCRDSYYEINNIAGNDSHIIDNIRNGLYSDFHCCRPMKDYSYINYKVYALL